MAVNLAFIIIAHERATDLYDLVDTLSTGGNVVCVHYDANASDAEFGRLQDLCKARNDILFAKRERCGWGEFSLVQATLNGLTTLREAKIDFDYVCLLSGADLPIKPLSALRAFLAQQLSTRTEFMEFVPLDRSQWVKGGLERERFVYRHYFNERRHPKLFQYCWKAQRALGLKTVQPRGLRLVLGSQWWCLTWETCLKVLDHLEAQPEIVKYFRSTWIPDESFFQTVVGALVPEERIRNHSLTFYQFSDYCKPYVFFDEHEDFLRRQNFFFGRKVAYSASGLRRRLLELGRSQQLLEPDDNKVGRGTGELDALRMPRRRPWPNRRVLGHRQHDPEQNDISFTGKLILIYVTPTSSEHSNSLSAKHLDSEAGWILHGHLFDAEKIHFAGNLAVFGGYEDHDVTARDANPGAFLSNVAGAGPAVTAFFASPTQIMPLLPCIRKASNVFIAVAQGPGIDTGTLSPLDVHSRAIKGESEAERRHHAGTRELLDSLPLLLAREDHRPANVFTESSLDLLLVRASEYAPEKSQALFRAATQISECLGLAANKALSLKDCGRS